MKNLCAVVEKKSLWLVLAIMLAISVFTRDESNTFIAITLLLHLLTFFILSLCRLTGALESNLGKYFNYFGLLISSIGIFAVISYLL